MNQRDIELLSSYLDGELKPSESARLEARFKSEPELVSVLEDLRGARGLLRRLPQRRAPRNFTLTRKMVGQNPPLPRSYSFFRFATTIATLVFFFTFGLNFMARQLAASPATGFGGGGNADSFAEQSAPFATEAPATEAPATEAPAIEMPPAATEAPAEPAPLPTQQPPTEGAARIEATPVEKNGAAADSTAQESQVQNSTPLIPFIFQVTLAVVAILGALFMVFLRRSAANRWR